MMSPRVKNIIIGSIFAVMAIIFVNELRIWVVAIQPIQDLDNKIEQELEEGRQEVANSIDRKCIDNPDFVYCNNN